MQTVYTLIKRRVLRHLVWVYTFCQCPFYGTLGLNGLIYNTMTATKTNVIGITEKKISLVHGIDVSGYLDDFIECDLHILLRSCYLKFSKHTNTLT